MTRLPPRDLAEVAERVGTAWRELAGGHVLVTGAAGFVGSWMTESLLHASEALSLGVTATALVRNAAAFRERYPHLVASPALAVREADVRTFDTPTPPTHVVHAATATAPSRPDFDVDDVIDTIEAGTRHVLDVAAAARSHRVLIISSGSVYDRKREGAARLHEDHSTLESGTTRADRFSVAKRVAERSAMGAEVPTGIARIFAVHGPRLPLDGQFAIGQFLADAVAARPIRVSGDGSPIRTYLYAADMATWCWTILLRGQSRRAYNVGAEQERTIADVAEGVARLAEPPLSVTRACDGPRGDRVDRYVPDVSRARDELGLDTWTDFEAGLMKTWAWLRAGPA